MADERTDWAGIPMPLDGQDLVIEPSFPNAAGLAAVTAPDEPAEDDGWRVRNRWYSLRKRSDVAIMERDGEIAWATIPGFHHLDHDLRTLGASVAWGLEQEHAAVQLLGTLVRHRKLKEYLLTGMLLERSPRSGVTYLFRRLKPTVAMAAWPGFDIDRQQMRILCTLCMHPIAYYAGSWAGAMCPTDDVIAHLSLMRADEAMFWRRCNQHPPYRPEAGL